MNPAAIDILVNANTREATAALRRTNEQLAATVWDDIEWPWPTFASHMRRPYDRRRDGDV